VYCARQGTLQDDVFLGALIGVATFSKYDLLQNVFASRPTDFLAHGVYTCRFYVEGEWVDVITDTSLPCLRDDVTGKFQPVYAHSANSNECWISLAEKAYAKAVGSYEAIQKIRVQEALLHLTGGSIQQINIADEVAAHNGDTSQLWHTLVDRLRHDTLVMTTPKAHSQSEETLSGGGGGFTEEEGGGGESTTTTGAGGGGGAAHASASSAEGGDGYAGGRGGGGAVQQGTSAALDEPLFLQQKLYSVVLCREFDHTHQLVLLHDPWTEPGQQCWNGPWSLNAPEWDKHPEILHELEQSTHVPWTRASPNGYFWMPLKAFVEHFNCTYYCKLFPNEKYSFYCVRGDWISKQAGGPIATVRDRAIAAAEANESQIRASIKATAAVVLDGDCSWFNNPQFRITAHKPCSVYISVVPLSSEGTDGAQLVAIGVVASAKVPNCPQHLWDAATSEVIAQDKVDGAGRVRGQEASIWALEIDQRHYYHIVPHTLRRGQEGSFITRVYSTAPIVVEKINELPTQILSGEWRRTGDLDTTGGPTHLTVESVTSVNTKWCQNPQFHLEVIDPFAHDEIHLKLVLRRTDKGATAGGGGGAGGGAGGHRGTMLGGQQEKTEVNVGLVITKAETLEDSAPQRKKAGPRQNALGEFIAAKPSSLKKKRPKSLEDAPPTGSDSGKTVLRKVHLSPLPESYLLQTTFSSRTEASVYYPKLPRSWIPNGFIITPCLTEKGVKGSFDLEVYCSEKVSIKQLPDAYSRSVAGEWTESYCGGSHLNQTWKKNPRFALKFKASSKGSAPVRIRITVAKHGPTWRAMSRKDTVGCMLGLYVFVNRGGESSIQVFEAPFSPDDELSTPADFTLEQLGADEEYIIMPTTFAEGKIGAFVITLMADTEFSFSKEK